MDYNEKEQVRAIDVSTGTSPISTFCTQGDFGVGKMFVSAHRNVSSQEFERDGGWTGKVAVLTMRKRQPAHGWSKMQPTMRRRSAHDSKHTNESRIDQTRLKLIDGSSTVYFGMW